MKLLNLCPLHLNVNPTLAFYRTLLLLNLCHQIRTLGSSESGESSGSESGELFNTPNKPHHHHQHYHPRGHGRVPSSSSVSLPPTVSESIAESSHENSVKYPRNSNNVIVRATSSGSRDRNIHSQFNFARSPSHRQGSYSSSSSTPHPPPSAAPTQQPDSSMPEETLRKMRLELIKQQILKKLRLTEPPKPPPSPHYRSRHHASSSSNTNHAKNLPLPVILGETLPKHSAAHSSSHYSEGDRDVEDFYGKTEQVIVFPDETESDCGTLSDHTHPSSCFLFKLPQGQIRWEEIASVELWVFKLPDPNDGLAQSFYVNQLPSKTTTATPTTIVAAPGSTTADNRERILGIKSNIRLTRGWFSFNLTSTAINWLRKGEYEQALQLGCSTCAKFAGEADEQESDDVDGDVDVEDEEDDLGSPVGTEGEERPFLVFNMAGAVVKKRSRRHINCSPGVRECCRERFVVDFKEIGWDWVVGPQSYDAFFCKGSCVGVNGLSSSASRRASIIGKYINTYGNNNNTRELIPCCTATRMSSISLVWNDWGVNSTTPSTRTETLPNMVVEACGCL